jgi:hypothetical protein
MNCAHFGVSWVFAPLRSLIDGEWYFRNAVTAAASEFVS